MNYVRLFYNTLIKATKRKKLDLHEPFFDKLESQLVDESIQKKSISSKGKFLSKFILQLKRLTKSKYVVLTSSGTAALHLAMLSVGVSRNTEVLMPSLNYIASANAALYCNAIPHFVDVNKNTLGVDPIKLENYLNEISTEKKNYCINKKSGNVIKALVCFHPFGYPASIDELKKICNKFNIKLIEDAAESIGSYLNNKHLGTFGDIGILSFNGNKTITTGSGGAILTNNKNLKKHCEILGSIAKKKHLFKFDYFYKGYNYKMANINAALGVAQISKINKIVTKKKRIFLNYIKYFKKLDFVKIYNPPKVSSCNYWLVTSILNKPNNTLKNKILNYCNKKGVFVRPSFKLLHTISYLKKYPRMNLNNSINLDKRIISLPSSPFL